MSQRATGRISLVTAATALVLALFAGLSFFLFVKELDQFKKGIPGDSEGFSHWLKPDHALPLSSNGQIDLLTGCIIALESWKTRFQPHDEVATVAQNCATEAERILGFNPHLSEAHYLKAYVAYLDGQMDQAVRNLARAQETAPSDQWLAVRRVNLAQAISPGQARLEHYNLQDDLGLLIASNRGLDTAARLYIKYPDLREMIIQSTEPLSDAARRRFLSRLQRAVAKR